MTRTGQGASQSNAVNAFSVQTGTTVTAVDMVFETIKRSREGMRFADIQAKTGFGEKKIRNIIFRLNKIGKIKRKSRGIYIAA